MRKTILASLTVIMTVSTFLFVGCGSMETDVPVSADAVEETQEIKTESMEPIASAEKIEESQVIETEESSKVVESTEIVIEETVEESTEESKGVVIKSVVDEIVDDEPRIFSFTSLSVTMYVKDSIDVGTAPDEYGYVLGTLSAKDEVHVTGQCNETGWYRIDYNGQEGYVSNDYLSEVKEEVAETPQESSVQTSTVAPNVVDNSPEGNWAPEPDWSDGTYTYQDLGGYEFRDGPYTVYSDINKSSVIATTYNPYFYGEYQCLENGMVYGSYMTGTVTNNVIDIAYGWIEP